MNRDVQKNYNNNFYKIMAENFGDEIFVTDGTGRVLFVNFAAVKVIGRPGEQIIGRNVKELDWIRFDGLLWNWIFQYTIAK